jgi:hypothetical protein
MATSSSTSAGSFADGTGIKMIETIHRSFGRSVITHVASHAPRPRRSSVSGSTVLSIETDLEAERRSRFRSVPRVEGEPPGVRPQPQSPPLGHCIVEGDAEASPNCSLAEVR